MGAGRPSIRSPFFLPSIQSKRRHKHGNSRAAGCNKANYTSAPSTSSNCYLCEEALSWQHCSSHLSEAEHTAT